MTNKTDSFLSFNDGYLFETLMKRLTDKEVFKKVIDEGIIKIDFESLKFFLQKEIGFIFYDRSPLILPEDMIMYPAYSLLLLDTYLFKIKLPATKEEIESQFLKRHLVFPPYGLVNVLEQIPDQKLYEKRFLSIGKYPKAGLFYSLINFSENGSGSHSSEFVGTIKIQDGYGSAKDTWTIGVKET
ncbi:MAG: hypothetical protein U0469_01010 [Candidatus Paceibacterota bacterium]|jgi:hypothetical protein